MRITFKSFDSKMASREKLFKTAVEFANKIDRKDMINITHSEDRDNIVITIWYYTDEAERPDMRGRPGVVSTVKVTPARPTLQGLASKNAEADGSSGDEQVRRHKETHHGLPTIPPSNAPDSGPK
jgi:hypothetical protein